VIKLAVPVEIVTRHGAPHCATVPEDSADEIAQCVFAICATEIGQRLELPGFGINDPAFVGVNLAELRAAIETWEPRAVTLLDDEIEGIMQTVSVGIQ
jgi:phage baseplate assembly protein W